MKVRAAVAVAAGKPLEIHDVDLEGPKAGEVLVELKAIDKTTKREESQVLNYLRATGLRVALIINFGDPGRLDWMRIVL